MTFCHGAKKGWEPLKPSTTNAHTTHIVGVNGRWHRQRSGTMRNSVDWHQGERHRRNFRILREIEVEEHEVTSDFRPEVEIRQFRACTSKNMRTLIYDRIAEFHRLTEMTVSVIVDSAMGQILRSTEHISSLWSPYVIGQTIYIFIL